MCLSAAHVYLCITIGITSLSPECPCISLPIKRKHENETTVQAWPMVHLVSRAKRIVANRDCHRKRKAAEVKEEEREEAGYQPRLSN